MDSDLDLIIKETEELLLEAHKNCMSQSCNKRTVIHFLMHELFHFFMTHLAGKRLVAEHGDDGKNFLKNEDCLRFGYRNERLLPIEVKDSLSIKKRVVFGVFVVFNFLTLGKFPRVYLGQVSFKWYDLILLFFKKKRIPYLLEKAT